MNKNVVNTSVAEVCAYIERTKCRVLTKEDLKELQAMRMALMIAEESHGLDPTHHLFSLGNAKLPSDCAIFNLLAVEDCVNCSTCAATCYARFRQGCPTVHKFRKANSDLARNYHAIFILKAVLELKMLQIKKGIKYVRIHESGDFFDLGYYLAWRIIADDMRSLSFFAMTKNQEVVEIDKLMGKEKNLNIINSMIDGEIRNYGSEEFCAKLVKEKGAHLCPDDNHNHICLNTCKYCLTGDKPCFKIHGSLKGHDTYEQTITKD